MLGVVILLSCLFSGEYAEWEKRTNWELGVRIPLIMRVPWMPSASSGKHARGLVEVRESVDSAMHGAFSNSI